MRPWTPAPPSTEASDVFAVVWPMWLDVIKTMAPATIGAMLTILAIHWVVGAVSKGRPPTIGGGVGGDGPKRVERPYRDEASRWYEDDGVGRR